MSERIPLADAKRWVVKIGSSLITNQGLGIERERIDDWAAQLSALASSGREVILVSSGAVAEGRARLGLSERPSELSSLQAAAAVGQMGLIHAFERAFVPHDRQTAQILLTHDDVSDRRRYLNVRQALLKLLEWDVIPVVNENDTVATEELGLADNDTLAALVCNLTEADALLILTDQDGLYTADPRSHADVELIDAIPAADPSLDAMAGMGRGELGRGGMKTKLLAARWAARSGAATVIAGGLLPDVIRRVTDGERLGSWLQPDTDIMSARKRWMAGPLRPDGALQLDAGAVRALRRGGRSLLAVGVVSVSGIFQRGDLVSCQDADGVEIARGLCNYDSDESALIAGKASGEIAGILSRSSEREMVHCNNMVLIDY